MGEKLEMLFRRFVLQGQNSDGGFGQVVMENLVVLFRRFLLFEGNVRCSRESPNNREPCPKVGSFAVVLVHLNHIASVIVNANHGIV